MPDFQNIFANSLDAGQKVGAQIQDAQDQRAKIQAGRSLSQGDYNGAAAQLGNAGMIGPQTQLMEAGHDQEVKAAQLKADNLVKVAQGLKAVPVGQRASALQSALPQLQQAGIDPGPFAKLDESHLSDQQLDMFTATLGKAVEEYTLAPGAARYRGANKMAEQPLSPKFQVLKPGDTLVSTDPNDAGTVAGSNLPPAAQAAPGTAAPTDASQPRGLRNNNPLNLSTLPHGHEWDGQTGTDGRYATFATPEQGMAAADQNLQAYATRHGIKTLSGVIGRWAPPGENDTAKYIATVSQDLGVAPDQPLNLADPQVRKSVLTSMAKVELGQALPQAAAPKGQAGAHVLYQAPAATEEDAPLSSDAVQLLAGKYLNNGTLPPMGMGKTGTRNRTLILNKATELAKALGLDANDLVAGTVTGKAAGQALGKATTIRSQVEASENTVLKNGQAALSLADRVGGPTRAPVINRWIQAGRKNLAGDPEVAAFHIAVNTVATEYAKVMTTSTGTGGTTSDSARQDAERMINTAQTPEQLRAVISQMKVEMDNRAQSLRDVEAGLRNTVRNGGQPGGMGSGPAQAPAAASAPAAPPRPAPPRNRPPLSAIFR